ncbi:MAG TPA: glycosyltransferase [Tepidisphaeraceae bacterium]|nr:glycosyltransferase [Tepidisphaeraceae bacterium]
MRLLHIIGTLDQGYGGPVTGLAGLSESLVALGHSVSIVTLDAPGEAPLPAIPGVEFIQLGPTYGKLGGAPYRYCPRLVPWLRANCGRFDAVIVHGIWQYQSFGTWRALRGRLPYFVFVHGALDPWFKRHYPLKHLKKWLYWPWAEYRVLRDAAGVIFTSADERILARESFWLYKVREIEWRYGIKPPADDVEQSRRAFFDAFPHLAGKRLILFLSRIHAKKGCDLAIFAFARVCSRDPALELVMAGPDQEGSVPSLRELAQQAGVGDRVHFVGMLNGAAKWGALRAAEAFILPSHSENFGIAVVEAMACGTPVLISNKVNIWQEIETGGAGIVENDDLEGTISNLKKWLDLPAERRDRMKLAAQRTFVDKFVIGKNAKELVELMSRASNGEDHL